MKKHSCVVFLQNLGIHTTQGDDPHGERKFSILFSLYTYPIFRNKIEKRISALLISNVGLGTGPLPCSYVPRQRIGSGELLKPGDGQQHHRLLPC